MSWAYKEAHHSKLYKESRPTYPEELQETVLSWLPTSDNRQWKTAVDVGCGSGQSTLQLCDHFETVIGVDSSESQLNEAQQLAASKNKQNVKYLIGAADDLSFLEDDSADLVTAATATHWFDFEKFFQEALRILKPNGVLAVYCYGFPTIKTTEVEKAILQPLKEKFGGVWPTPLLHLENHYSDIYASLSNVFPVSQRVDSMKMERKYRFDELVRVFESTSFYQRYRQENAKDADQPSEVETVLKSVFLKDKSAVDNLFSLTYPLFLLLGRKDVK